MSVAIARSPHLIGAYWLGLCGHSWPAPDPFFPTPCPTCRPPEVAVDA